MALQKAVPVYRWLLFLLLVGGISIGGADRATNTSEALKAFAWMYTSRPRPELKGRSGIHKNRAEVYCAVFNSDKQCLMAFSINHRKQIEWKMGKCFELYENDYDRYDYERQFQDCCGSVRDPNLPPCVVVDKLRRIPDDGELDEYCKRRKRPGYKDPLLQPPRTEECPPKRGEKTSDVLKAVPHMYASRKPTTRKGFYKNAKEAHCRIYEKNKQCVMEFSLDVAKKNAWKDGKCFELGNEEDLMEISYELCCAQTPPDDVPCEAIDELANFDDGGEVDDYCKLQNAPGFESPFTVLAGTKACPPPPPPSRVGKSLKLELAIFGMILLSFVVLN